MAIFNSYRIEKIVCSISLGNPRKNNTNQLCVARSCCVHNGCSALLGGSSQVEIDFECLGRPREILGCEAERRMSDMSLFPVLKGKDDLTSFYVHINRTSQDIRLCVYPYVTVCVCVLLFVYAPIYYFLPYILRCVSKNVESSTAT